MTLLGFELTGPVLLLGVIVGMTYGLLGVGLVLVYRANKIINFAHGEIGSLGAAFLGVAVVRWDAPYWLVLPAAIALSSSVGALTEVVVIRRFRKAPKLMSVIATLGMSALLFGVSRAIGGAASRSGANFPVPPMPTFFFGPLRVTEAFVSILVLTPVIVGAVFWFLRFSRFGIAIRAAAANPDRARTVGIPPGRMSTIAWAIAGALAAFTAITVFPTRGFLFQSALGPALLVRALVPAVLARMESLPVVFVGGVAVGVVEQHLIWNYPASPGVTELVLFVVVLGVLMLQRSRREEDDDKGRWAAVQPWKPLPDALQQVWVLRHLGKLFASGVVVLAVIAPLVLTNHSAIVIAAIMALAIVGLSVGIITGLGGQLSLGQFALCGVGALLSSVVTSETGNFGLGLLTAVVGSAAASIVVGLPGIRVRGLSLTVTTLAFAVAAQSWLFSQSWAFPGNAGSPDRPKIGPISFEQDRRYLYIALVWLIVSVWFARNVWRGGLGRRLRSVRDNEDGSRAFGIPATAVKVQTFALAGAFAGLGGALFGHSLTSLASLTFGVEGNINQVAMAALGGIGTLAGPVIGAFYIIGVPRFLPLDAAGLAASAFGWLLLLLYVPGGLAQIIAPIRARVIHAIAIRKGIPFEDASLTGRDVTEGLPTARPSALVAGRSAATVSGSIDAPPALQARGLRLRFGGLKAVDGVDLDVRHGEVLGIIGPNGAGKSTLFDLLSGFLQPDDGTVHLLGKDVTHLRAEQRAHAGLIRSFQDAALFPTLTVLEVIQLAMERSMPTRVAPSLLGDVRTDRRQETRAREIIAAFGLDSFRTRQIRELSTGTRRITELACALALEPRVLLLDEPSSGIAQRETEALGGLLLQLRSVADTTLVVIEHDIQLIMSISNRIVALESGKVIAEGSPKVVQRDPVVIAAYLGTTNNGRAAKPARRRREGRCESITTAGTRCTRSAVFDGVCRQHALGDRGADELAAR
jgi:ABC-type branched-subunit amino acid transport system ATPase component/ABC-type branched-subunit amino acid transport system permease subunit